MFPKAFHNGLQKELGLPRRLIFQTGSPESVESEEAQQGRVADLHQELTRFELLTNDQIYSNYNALLPRLRLRVPALPAALPSAMAVTPALRNQIRQALEGEYFEYLSTEEQQHIQSIPAPLHNQTLRQYQEQAIGLLNQLRINAAAGGQQDEVMDTIHTMANDLGPVQNGNARYIREYLEQKAATESQELQLEQAKAALEDARVYRQELDHALSQLQERGVDRWVNTWSKRLGMATGIIAPSFGMLTGLVTAGSWWWVPLTMSGYGLLGAGIGAVAIGAGMGVNALLKKYWTKEAQKTTLLRQFDEGTLRATDISQLSNLDAAIRGTLGAGFTAVAPNQSGSYRARQRAQETAQRAVDAATNRLKAMEKSIDNKKAMFAKAAERVDKQLKYYADLVAQGDTRPEVRRRREQLELAKQLVNNLGEMYGFAKNQMANIDITSREVARMFKAEHHAEQSRAGRMKKVTKDANTRVREAEGAVENETERNEAYALLRNLAGPQRDALNDFINRNRAGLIASPKALQWMRTTGTPDKLQSYLQHVMNLPVDHPRRREFFAEADAAYQEVNVLRNSLASEITNLSANPALADISLWFGSPVGRQKIATDLRAYLAAADRGNLRQRLLTAPGTLGNINDFINALGSRQELEQANALVRHIAENTVVKHLSGSGSTKALAPINASTVNKEIVEKQQLMNEANQAMNQLLTATGRPAPVAGAPASSQISRVDVLNPPPVGATLNILPTPLDFQSNSLQFGGMSIQQIAQSNPQSLEFLHDFVTSLLSYVRQGYLQWDGANREYLGRNTSAGIGMRLYTPDGTRHTLT